MQRKSILLSILLCVLWGFLSAEPEWGIRYGMGSSIPFGDETKYLLRYDISSIGAVETDFGYLKMESLSVDRDGAHNLGLYYTWLLKQSFDSVWLQTEVQWERYSFSYKFNNKILSTNSLLLSNTFGDTLRGSIYQTLDYISIPFLVKLKQGFDPEAEQGHFGGAYIYLGPSISIAVNTESYNTSGIKALETDIAEFVRESQNDSNPNQEYASKRRSSAADKVLVHKLDYVFGAGFELRNLFEMGFGKEEYLIDCRANVGMYPIGNAQSKTEFKLNSIILSLGIRL